MSDPSEREPYEKLIAWLRKAWWGLPDSEHLMPTIKAFFSPEEAKLLTGIPFSGRTLEELAEMKGMAPAELASRLDALARRGAVWRSQKQGSIRYSLNDAFFVFMRGPYWASDPDEATKATARPFNKYFYDGFMDQFAKAHTKGLRAIPIDRTVEDPRRILPYEDVIRFVDSQDYCTVSYCPCRQRKRLDPDSEVCDHPMEVCLHFGRLGHYIVENGLGREITREETKEILTQAAESGLVHAISNWQEGADTICNCCKCCCLFFEAYHVLKHSKSHDVSNYQVRTSQETCKACGLCVERCPVGALRLEDSPMAANKKGKAAKADIEKCIGCGVCAYKCPTRSLVLVRREKTSEPPRDVREWMERWYSDTGSR
jgi:electron transport complex protein RnfB